MTSNVLSIALALVLTLTSQAMAVARGASVATGQMVICTGGSPMVVFVDADGAPTSAPHFCPDSIIAAVSDPLKPLPSAPIAKARAFVSLTWPHQQSGLIHRSQRQTRAPPTFV